MFSATTEACGNLFMLDFMPQLGCRATVPESMLNSPVMFGSIMFHDGSMSPVKALLSREHIDDPESEPRLRLIFGQSHALSYEGELWSTGRRGYKDGELSAGEDPNAPDFQGYVDIAPTINGQQQTESVCGARLAAGQVGIYGRMVRNADGSVRIALTMTSNVVEDTNQLQAGIAI